MRLISHFSNLSINLIGHLAKKKFLINFRFKFHWPELSKWYQWVSDEYCYLKQCENGKLKLSFPDGRNILKHNEINIKGVSYFITYISRHFYYMINNYYEMGFRPGAK
jgi:hypothetical protein